MGFPGRSDLWVVAASTEKLGHLLALVVRMSYGGGCNMFAVYDLRASMWVVAVTTITQTCWQPCCWLRLKWVEHDGQLCLIIVFDPAHL
jgi:hypothetical protein